MKGFKAFAGLEPHTSASASAFPGQLPLRGLSDMPPLSMSLLEAHAKIMRARQNNLQLKQELARRIIVDNQRAQQQQQQQQQLPPLLASQGKNSDPFLIEKIAQLEKALESLTAGQGKQQKQEQQALPLPESKAGPLMKMATAVKVTSLLRKALVPPPASDSAKPTSVAQPIPRDRGEAAKMEEQQQQQQQLNPPPAPRRVPPLPLAPPPAAPAALPSVDPKKLSMLAEQISAQVAANSKLLGTKDEEEEGTMRDHNEAKNRMRKLLQRAEKHHQKLPLWRHYLRGVRDPPPEAVLKGKSLFRGIAKAVICLLLRPKLIILRRRTQLRAKETAELAKDMVAYSEEVCGWLGRTTKVPLSSAEQDASLDLDTRAVGLGSAAGKQRLMHLKVRVKGVVAALAESALPPEHICTFLISLMEDNNYFPEGYLSEQQCSVLEFSDLGGTRNMLVAVGDSAAPPTLLDGMKRREHLMGAKKDRRVDVTRARMVLVDFLFVRMLLGQCVMRPWRHGVCKAPKRRVGTVVNNLRMIGTCLYYILRQTEGHLPSIVRLAPDGEQDAASAAAAATAAETAAATAAAAPKSDEPSRLSAFLGGLTGPSSQADPKQKKQDDDELIKQVMRVDTGDYFRSQAAVLGELVPADEMAAAKAFIDEWLPDLVVKMDEYIKRLMEHLFDARIALRGASFDDEIEALNEANASEGKLGLLSPRAAMSPRLALQQATAAAMSPTGRPATKTTGRPGTRQKLAPPPK